ncbi:hypothetical protein SAMD00023353_0301120 [Rosellinia necatrix]|uniref:Uncharacterized protein n=1 Tax=Rosellinia necatrix TaxID=77044 RepID=A0A1S8A548_ROSNE|nr:hypothetical protein SAMD00023353_0301120 [Rosellinia necatrix]
MQSEEKGAGAKPIESRNSLYDEVTGCWCLASSLARSPTLKGTTPSVFPDDQELRDGDVVSEHEPDQAGRERDERRHVPPRSRLYVGNILARSRIMYIMLDRQMGCRFSNLKLCQPSGTSRDAQLIPHTRFNPLGNAVRQRPLDSQICNDEALLNYSTPTGVPRALHAGNCIAITPASKSAALRDERRGMWRCG